MIRTHESALEEEARRLTTDYRTSRARFRAAAFAAGCDIESLPIERRGPDDQVLATDIAIRGGDGSAPDGRTLIVSSGLHGVEGGFGSAVQSAALERIDSMPSLRAIRTVWIHAANPFGFALGRRFDQENIDLNRNFLLAGDPYDGVPDGYDRLAPLLIPERPAGRFDLFGLRMAGEVIRSGFAAVANASVGGQYRDARGLFFGGFGPSDWHRRCRERMCDWIGPTELAIHLDLHTGFGPWGVGQLLLDATVERSEVERWRARFGSFPVITSERVEQSGGEKVAAVYTTRGDWGRWSLEERLADDYRYACFEFGTYRPLKVLAGLRAENAAFHHAETTSPAARRSRRRLEELFVPASLDWRRRVLGQGLEGIALGAAQAADSREPIMPPRPLP